MPVVVADLDGERYLVSMLGKKSQWGSERARRRRPRCAAPRRRAPVRLAEVPEAACAPVLKRYLALAPGARAHIPVDQEAPLREFERVAGDYPVFHVGQDAPSVLREERNNGG